MGVKVNGKLVSLSHQLKSGDQAEVITSKKQRPRKDWLRFVVTSRAKSKIKSALKEDKKNISVVGKELAERKLKVEGLTARGLTVYGTKYQLEHDPWGERIDDPLTPQDERYDCGDFGNCYFDHNTFTDIYE